ncbi:aminotransferase class I/II-fold pyridoxal phosphate-dependent enzyme [Streptomyces sp. CG1]|uniref:aminotransferase class I/II-fold pyridoxal phosphate-dependent enzyme n=1 Tax=Streptomyces sp. CG1 TaxID=1287523 RepID=UPI0034E1B9F6
MTETLTGSARSDQPSAAAASGTTAGETYLRIVDIIARYTLYDHEQLLLESHFEGELGIDSVIMESILAAVRDQFGITVELPAAPPTIGDLVQAVERANRPADGRPVGDGPERNARSRDTVMDLLLDVAMRHTQYQRHQLDPDADLEGELGIDSVVLASIVAEVSREIDGPTAQTQNISATTLRSLGAALAGSAPDTAPPQSAEPGSVPVQRAEHAHRPAPTRLPAPDPARRPSEQAPTVSATDGPWDDRSMRDFTEERDSDLFAKVRSFRGYLRRREDEQLYWYGMPLQSRCENRAVIQDELTGRTREYLMFASNNYLGLANHPKVIDAICDATRVYGATNTGCRLIGGTNVLHKELERRLAAFKQRPACIVFPGGYSANLGAISALVKSYDAVVVDKYNHMSIVDGARISGGVRKIYQHNDMADLQRVLERCPDQLAGKLIVADGVFSMHGDVCNLPGIVRLAKQYGARVLIDDAHSTGVLGARGSGTTEHFGLKGEVDLELGTMSKTLAGMGGFVVGDEDVIEYLRFYAHSYVFAATIPAGIAAGLIAAIDVIEREPERIARLWSNIRTLRSRLRDTGFDLENTDSAILPIVIRDERRAMEMGRAVRARGLFCQTVVFPGVGLGDARLRISVTSEHTPQDLDEAAQIFEDAGRETGVLPARGRDTAMPGAGERWAGR